MMRPSVSRGLGILIMLALIAAIACGGATTATSPAPAAATSAPTAVPGETPASVPAAAPTDAPPPAAGAKPVAQRLRVISRSERESNDPAQVISHHMHQFDNVLETLFYDDQFAKFVPNLVSEWSVSPDGKNWTFELRKGVPFHGDWGEFTTKDVVHTIERLTRPDSANTRIDDLKMFLGSHEVVDDYEMVFRLPQPFLDGPFLFSGQVQTHILSKEFFDTKGQAGVQEEMIGTGPYRFVERSSGAYVLHEQVPYEHWRVAPDFQELQFFFVIEPSTSLAMLLADEVDIGVLPFDLQSTALGQGLEVVQSTAPTIVVYAEFGGNYLPTSEYYDDTIPVPWALPGEAGRKVRKALNLAINREEIQDTILGGRGETMPITFWASHLRGWDPGWIERFKVDYRYDPLRAKELLAEVEAELGEPLDWSQSIYLLTPRPELGELADIGEAVANYWRDVGVPIKLEEREFAYFLEKFLAGKIHGIAWTDATPWRSTDREQIRVIYVSKSKDGPVNFFESQFVEDKYDEFLATVNLDERDRILREIGEHLFVEYATAPMFSIHSEYVINPRVVADYQTSGLRPPRHLEYAKAVMK